MRLTPVVRGPSGLLGAIGTLVLACASPSANEDEGSNDTSSSSSSSSSTADTGTADTGTADTGTAEDQLPPAPELVTPGDGATDQPLELELCWELVEDPEGEPLRYRVFIDDTVLSGGILEGEEGHAGPCVGPLLFVHERSYSWRVEAFEVDDPTRSSPPSPTWTFTTIGDGLSELVFEDDFEDDLGWEISGDAGSGAWIRGDPMAASDAGVTSQPGACAGGTSCFFTGQNPSGAPDDADVDAGATILTSPSFDLGGAATATVRLQRFFYSSDALASPSLRVELLVPNGNGEDAHELELLDEATTTLAANAWTPREYVACGVPMVDGSRLRFTATDTGAGILEAAIDSVSVHAHDDPVVCESGEGGACDPSAPTPCPGELLCCARGPINVGVHRCAPAVASLDYDDPPASAADPGNGPLGCDGPDLIVDPTIIVPSFADIFISQNTCELLEGCVDSTGWRRVMLFSVSTPNIGSADLALGVPANLPELFHYSECHSHYHFDEYARYELRDAEDALVAEGHKQAFCMIDLISWAWPLELPKFDCSNQGISRGFSDTYDAGLPCQWVDVTDTPPGDYTLRVSLNQPPADHALPRLMERDYSNNVIEVPVTIPP